ncbi:Clavaminate synthase-like protein [Chiua virens]|nr:Clavaminate synthase-like protein [Chiua virens]
MSSLRRSYTLLRDLSLLRSLPRQRYSTLAEVLSLIYITFPRKLIGPTAQDVRADATFRIPIIDFSAFRIASAPSEKRRIADDIVNGFKEVGFVYLSGHGIPQSVIDNVYNKSASFFSLPQQIKDKVAWDDPRANRGYVKVGRERVTQSSDAAEIATLRAKAPDTKESMEIGREWDPVWKNKWVREADSPGFKDTMLQFFQTCHELHVAVMRSIALGLDLQESFFDRKVDQQCHNLRLLSYPSIRTKLLLKEGQARAGAHSDYGTITLLFQDSVGGLEVQNPYTQHFQPAHPVPGTIVVNAGDLLARWSNDVLRSTLHRVVAPPAQKISDTECMTPVRQSIAFFCNPNFDATIESLPTCVGTANPSKYKSVTTEEYIVGRLAATYD